MYVRRDAFGLLLEKYLHRYVCAVNNLFAFSFSSPLQYPVQIDTGSYLEVSFVISLPLPYPANCADLCVFPCFPLNFDFKLGFY